jgi:phage terminase small subunit
LAPPSSLRGEALAFWDRHAGRLRDAGILTPADLDSFVLLCRTHALLDALHAVVEPGADAFREMIQLVNLTKQYVALARQFGLLPRERKQAKMSVERPKPKDKFGL